MVGEDTGASEATDAGTSESADTGATSETDAAAASTDDTGVAATCSGGETGAAAVACAAGSFLATLDATDRDTVLYDFTDSVNKTCWSNLPGQSRAGITFGALGTESRAAAMAVARSVMSDDGYEDFRGLLAADDYLGTMSGGGGPGGGLAYGSDNAHIAVFGTPGSSEPWMLAIGNHHMAYNLTFTGTATYPTPNHMGAEPRGEFTIGGETFGPLVSEGQAFQALFASLDASTLSSAHLSGSFGDVVLGPDEYCSGDYGRVVFPTGSQRSGVLVSSLSAEQQALVTATIAEWVRDYVPAIADGLMEDYTSSDAYADTLVAWGGSGSAPDVTVNGTYFRIDGPRVWIEVSCQNGVVLSGTHYHTIYRDRSYDYGAML